MKHERKPLKRSCLFNKRMLVLYSLVTIVSGIRAMVFDNRWWPLYRQPFFGALAKELTHAHGFRALFMSAHHTIGDHVEESLMEGDELPLFRVHGKYDEVGLDRALQAAGVTTESLLRSDMRTLANQPWRPLGHIRFTGLVYEGELQLGKHGILGASLVAGKIHSNLDLSIVLERALPPGDLKELLLTNKALHDALKLCPPCYSEGVFGDIDLYGGVHVTRDYWHKIKKLDVGLNLGLLIPTAPAADLYNPAAVPLGGNKHFGMYGEFRGSFLLKEDTALSLWFRASKRFSRTACYRMPVNQEPNNYGALVGLAQVSPGWTVMFEPRVEFLGLRDGLGLSVAYVLVHHGQDSWTDLRADQSIKPNTDLLQERSSWGSDAFSVTALYDFGYDREAVKAFPVVSCTLDIPFKGLVARRVSRTYGISLRIEWQL